MPRILALAAANSSSVRTPWLWSWARFLDELWKRGVHTVLDLCCGTGLLAAELAGLGYRVTGVDASEPMLELARARAGDEVTLVRAALPELPVDGVFDAAVSTFDGFNYLSPDELRQTLHAVARRLVPAGWLVFDLHTDAMMAFTSGNPVVAGESAGNGFLIESAVDAAARTCETTIEVVRPREGEPFSERHRQYFHADGDVRAALESAGFGVEQVCDEYSSRPLDTESLRATWVSRLS